MKYVEMIATLLVIVGAVNWGLVGLGYFLGQNLNLVNLLLGFSMELEAVVYILVGLSGLWLLYDWVMKMNKK